jgi:hypothetical protein
MGSLSAVARGLGSAGTRAGQSAPAPVLGGMSPLAQSYENWSFGSVPALPRGWDTFASGAFGPLSPVVPVPIDTVHDGDDRPMPRRWEYQVGWNMPIGTPGTEGLKLATFATLRSIADLYSVVRACITMAVNDILGTEWDIVPTEQAEKAMHGNQAKQDDFAKRREEAMKFWSRPDPQYRGFEQWMRALCEDWLVIDAPALYIHPTWGRGHGPFGSSMASLDYIDGSTIRPLVDMRGSTPPAGQVAYQQYLWGVPRVDMTQPVLSDDEGITAVHVDDFIGDQLMYMPQYTRAWTPYGFSPVERALLPAATGLRRQLHALQFYTEGTIPGLFIVPGPDISTPSQIAQLQRALNNIAGDQAMRHKIIVLPPGTKTDPQKTINLADQFDQVLAAEVTMAFEYTPLDIGVAPRVASVQSPSASREFSQTNAQNTQKRGLKPRLSFLKANVFDFTMQRIWGQEDMQWRWTGIETGEDLTEKLTVWSGLQKMGVVSIDQVAQEFGVEPWGLPQTAEPLIFTATGAVPVSSIGQAPVMPGLPGAPALAALPPAGVQQAGEEAPDGAPAAGGGGGTAPAPPGQSGTRTPAAGLTPSHHAAAAASADAPEKHHAAKAAAAELGMLARFLRRGRPVRDFVRKALSPRALEAAEAALPHGVDAAVQAATVITKAEAKQRQRADQLARAHRAVAAGLGHLVREYRAGQRSGPATLDAGVAVMAGGYRQALTAGGDQAGEDHPDTPPVDLSGQAEQRAEAQRGYLSNLITAIVAGIAAADLASRLNQYGDTLNGAWNAGYGLTVQAAHPKYEIQWQLGAADHCKLCIDRDGKTFTFDTLPGWPGDGGFGGADAICLGGPNCHCSLIYREAGRDLAAGGNTQRDAAIPYYQGQLADITAAREQAAANREAFLATIPDGAAARAHTRDSLRQELADQANARVRDSGGYPGISHEGRDIPAGDVAALLPDWARGIEADLLKQAQDPGEVAKQVFEQLLADYPADSMGWVADGSVHWVGPMPVPLNDVDFSNAGAWQAAHEADKVAEFAKRIRKGKAKPVILVSTPDNRAKIVIDGHHRSLAYRKLGRPVIAYVGYTKTEKGPWLEFHSFQYSGHGTAGGQAYRAETAKPAKKKAAMIEKAGYSLNPRSGMISLDLAPGTVEQVPGGVDDHHITVVYLGPDVDDQAWHTACQAVAEVAAHTARLTGSVGGLGEFPAGEDGVPVFAKVDLPGAAGLYEALKHLQSPEAAAAKHGYKPHMTLTYAQDDARPDPVPDTPVRFAEISVHRGDDVARYPFGGAR